MFLMHPNGSFLSVPAKCAHSLKLIPFPRAIIKAASPDDELNVEALGREKKTYRLPGVSSAPCYRKIYDEIDDNTVALEWLDGTLQDLKYQPQSLIYAIIKASMRASLASAAVIERQEYVNTGTVPALGTSNPRPLNSPSRFQTRQHFDFRSHW